MIPSNFATAAEYARIGTPLGARVGDQAVMNLGEIGTLAFFCQCAIIDHFSDRGWVVPEVERRIAEAGPVARFLLRLNYRHLDRSLLPRPPEYTLVWEPPGSATDPDTWETSRARVRLLDQLTQRRIAVTADVHADLLGRLESTAIDSMARDVIASLPPGRGPVLLAASSPFDRYYQFRLAAALKRRHVSVRLDPETAGTPGEPKSTSAPAASPKRRTYDGKPVRTLLTVSSGHDINRLASRPAQVVAYVGTVSRAQRVEIATRARELEALHSSGQVTDQDYVNSLLSTQGKLGTDLAVISSSE